jgi:hypothetical protein
MLRFPWARYPVGVAVAHTVLLVISQVANAAGYFYERGRQHNS